TIDNIGPTVQSINRSNPLGPTASASSVTYTVTFSESVTGVDATDFQLALSGLTATTPVVVSGSGAVYTVTVNGIGGNGTLGLNLVDNGSIRDLAGNPLPGNSLTVFQSQAVISTSTSLHSPLLVDTNGDGKTDIVFTNFNKSSVSVFLGNGDGTFQGERTFAV